MKSVLIILLILVAISESLMLIKLSKMDNKMSIEFAQLNDNINNGFNDLNNRFNGMNNNFNKINNKLDNIEKIISMRR